MLDGDLKIPERGADGLFDVVPAQTFAQFVGIALSGTGFDQVYLRDIVVETSCFAEWCGGLSEGEVFVALSHEVSERRLALGPCGGDHMLVTPDAEARLLACHLDGACYSPN